MQYLTQLLGFKTKYLERLETADRDWLLRSNLLVIMGLGVMSFALALTYWQLSAQGSIDYFYAACVFLVSFLLLIQVHVLVILLSGPPLSNSRDQLSAWRPSPIRTLFFVFIAAFLAQPYLLWMQQDRLDTEVSEFLKFKTTAQLDGQIKGLAYSKQQTLMEQRTQLSDEWWRMTGMLDDFKEDKQSTQGLQQARLPNASRKALLIGSSFYSQTAQSLPVVANDIEALAKKLQGLGYQVTVSLNETHRETLLRFEEYSRSLQGGDTSFIYFSGYIYGDSGHNFFLPKDADFSSLQNKSLNNAQRRVIGLSPYVDDLTRARLGLHTIVVNACRMASADIQGQALASMQSRSGQAVAIALSSSPTQLPTNCRTDVYGKNTVFMAALLSSIHLGEPVKMVLDKVQSEVQKILSRTSLSTAGSSSTPWFFTSKSIADKSLSDEVLNRDQDSLQAGLLNGTDSHGCASSYQANSNSGDYLQCVTMQIAHLNKQIDFLQGLLDRGKVTEQVGLVKLIDRGTIFAARWRLMWEHYIFNFVATFFAILVMTAGLMMRELWHFRPLQLYEFMRHMAVKQSIKELFIQYQSSIDKHLSNLRLPSQLPSYQHWDSEFDFYSNNQAPSGSAISDKQRPTGTAEELWGWISQGKNKQEATS
jgi:hypothetical protein